MPNIGPMELILLGVVAVLLFGPARIPEMARSLGRATREFKDSVTGTGIGEALEGMNDVRTSVTPSNLAKAAMPAPVKEMAAGVTEMKAGVTEMTDTFTDPLGQKKQKAEAEAPDDEPSAEPDPLPAPREMPVMAAPVPAAPPAPEAPAAPQA
jgi:sec-independent protein translocase protein TatA